MRYVAADDFGLPETAFLICRFWLIDAIVGDGAERRGARHVRRRASDCATVTACCRKTCIPATGKLWGNFPQTYSMSGLILTAIKLSRSWGDRYWRGSS